MHHCHWSIGTHIPISSTLISGYGTFHLGSLHSVPAHSVETVDELTFLQSNDTLSSLFMPTMKGYSPSEVESALKT